MSYVELHAHSAFSFLDGASLPDELAAAALERGHTRARADRSRRRSRARWSSPRRPRPRAAGDPRRGADGPTWGPTARRHLTLLVRGRDGLGEPLPAPHDRAPRTRATGRRRGRALRATPSSPLDDASLEHAEGLVCLSGCASRGVEDEPTLRRLRDAFGPERLRIELQRPSSPATARATRRRDRARPAGSGWPPWPPATSTPTRAPARACRTRSSPSAWARHARRLRARAPRQPLPRPDHAGGDGRALRRRARGRGRDRARWPSGCEFDLSERPRLPLPGRRGRQARRGCSPSTAAWPSRTATRRGTGCATEARGAARGGARAHRRARAVGLLRAAPRHARARPGGGRRGPRPRHRRAPLLPPGRGRGSSVSSIVCYLTGLSHVDPIANQLLLGRFLNEEISALPDIDLDFPRDVREKLLPRIHDVYGRERSRSWPPSRPTGRAARSASSARRSGCRRGRSSAWRAARRAGRPTTSTATWPPRSGATGSPRGAGAGWPRWPTRSTACRATSPSTRAG